MSFKGFPLKPPISILLELVKKSGLSIVVLLTISPSTLQDSWVTTFAISFSSSSSKSGASFNKSGGFCSSWRPFLASIVAVRSFLRSLVCCRFLNPGVFGLKFLGKPLN